MAFARMFNLGQGGSIDTFAVDTLPGGSGQKGGIYEDNSQHRAQCFQLVDSTAVAGDVQYAKAHDGTWTATPTIGNSSAAEVAGVATTTVALNQFTLLRQGGLFAVKANGVFARGVPVWPDSGSNRVVPGGVFSGALANAADTGGAIISMVNPLTGPWLITSLIINRTTKSTGAGTADFGIGATATTSNDGLMDGLDIGATEANGENNFANAGTNGKAAKYGAAGTFLTGSTATGNVAGLVGTFSGTFVPTGAGGIARPVIIGVAQGAISTGKVSVFLTIPPI